MCDQENYSEFKIKDILGGVINILSIKNEYAATIGKFHQLNTNAERVSFADVLLKKYKLLPKFVRQEKDDGLSAKYRLEGNDAFKKKDDLTACKLYTKSIAHAKTNGECLGLAHANRSAVFYEKNMYKQCLEDITKAFEHNYPKNLHDKLIKRQLKARQFLSTQSTFKYYKPAPSLSRPSKTIQCANDCVEIRKSTVSGRQVVALERIKVGDVIAVEKPYACLLSKEYLCTHCSFCLELCYNMLPCESCVYAMFCSLQCRKAAWVKYHRYECPILANLYGLDAIDTMLMGLRIAIMAKKHYMKIDSYAAKNDTYKSQHYEEIHFLETNTHLRSIEELFLKAIVAAVLRNLISDGSSFHQHLDNPKGIFDELVMRHRQTCLTNFHTICESVEEDTNVLTMTLSPNVAIGIGAYAFLSLFNHSCYPNVVRTYHGSEIVVRAIRPIAKGDELVDDYGCHFAEVEKEERQRVLRETYFFNCACEACENNWPLGANMVSGQSTMDNAIVQKVTSSMYARMTTGEDVDRFMDRLYDICNEIPEQYPRYNKTLYMLQRHIKLYYRSIGNSRPIF